MVPGNLDPARLPLGTRVGPWRVLERRGRGAYGAVYRAIGAQGGRGTVALKLALLPRDERFVREAELLSRIHHPSVPRLIDAGEWQDPAGVLFPYLVMEWVEGLPLYDWAWEHRPGSRQVLQQLASLARALAATHAAGAVHRDVKGDNVLVRAVDGRAFLTDFGSGHYVGASTLTRERFPPGTPAYRSPEAWRSAQSPIPYAPGPADDVFALGVTAWRLVTDDYPSELELRDEEARRRKLSRCCGELRALISRMMSVHPEARGSARELAEALETAAREAGPKADAPLFAGKVALPVSAASRRVSRQVPAEARSHWRLVAGVGVPLALGVGWGLGVLPGTEPERLRASAFVDSKDGGTVAVGDSALTAPVSATVPPSAWSAIALDMPPKPFPGQLRPDSSGRCPRKALVAIHGGCWLKLALSAKDCGEEGYVYKDECYLPVFPPGRPATSGPAD
ncbi:serine/threonine-protein kinase [Pyxidicoccus sp. 3LG]